MSKNRLLNKTTLAVFLVIIACVSSANIRSLLWDDPFCNTFSPDGTSCLKCSYHYWKDKFGKCNAVSDMCKTWNETDGKCTSCFPGYNAPVNGVCGVVGNGTIG